MAESALVGRWERGRVAVDGRTVRYTVMMLAPEGNLGSQDPAAGGNLNVLVPGHGQTPAAVRNLAQAIASGSRSGVVWCIDVDPPAGGEPVKVQALIEAVRQLAQQAGWDLGRVTLFGWSHGGAEVLRAAAAEPALFEHVVAMCPTGLAERPVIRLILSLAWEYLTAVVEALWRRDGTVVRVATVALNALGGVTLDLLRGGSPLRLIKDVRWAARRVLARGGGW